MWNNICYNNLMSKNVWEGVRNPDKPYVPISEAPDRKPTLNPEERVILLDLFEKGLLEGEKLELAKEWLGIISDEAPEEKTEDYPEYEDQFDAKAIPKDVVEEEKEDDDGSSSVSPQMEAYISGLNQKDRKAFMEVQDLMRQKISKRGKTKRSWKSTPNSSRSTIRKPSPDGDVRLRRDFHN